MNHVFRQFLVFLLLSGMAASLSYCQTNLEAQIGRKVVVSENKTIFTLFSLLNLAGYDDENNVAGMYPVRTYVREQLAREVPPELTVRVRDFYRQHKGATPYQYSVVAMSTSGPPDFSFTTEWSDVKKVASFGQLEDLQPLLREFYAQAPVEKIYATVQPDYLRYIAAYQKAIAAQVAKAMTYCRVTTLSSMSGGEIEHAVVIPNLLESYDRAFAFVLQDRLNSVEGPHEKIGYNPHEFVHSITNPISYDAQYKALQAPAQPIYEFAKTIKGVGDLDSLQNYLDENLVRAISLKYLDDGTPAKSQRLHNEMMNEYRSGYILERFFYEQLSGYEKSKGSLADYYPAMLKQLDAKAELGRWKQDVKSSAQ
jgi:hypothetical protein